MFWQLGGKPLFESREAGEQEGSVLVVRLRESLARNAVDFEQTRWTIGIGDLDDFVRCSACIAPDLVEYLLRDCLLKSQFERDVVERFCEVFSKAVEEHS